MRHLHVLHVLNSADGGAALSTLGLMRYFHAQGVLNSAVCHADGTESEALLEATAGRTLFTPLYWMNRKTRAPWLKRPLIEAKQLVKTGLGLRSALTVIEAARCYGATLVHTNTILTPEGSLAARALDLPHVWHVRELVGEGRPFRLPREGAMFEPYMRRRCSALVANSETTAKCLRPWVREDGLLTVVPNGLDLRGFKSRRPHKHRSLVVGMVGNLTSRWKKHALFVAAAAQVKGDVVFHLFGHGDPLRDEYVREIAAQMQPLGHRMVLRGFLDSRDIMPQLDVLVHPADGESFGRVVVEAMAAGLPVVGVRGGGVAEIVEHGVTGLLAAVDDAADIARCIDEMVAKPEMRVRMGKTGRARAFANYSIEACGTRMLDLYARLS